MKWTGKEITVTESDQAFFSNLVRRNRYLALATCDDGIPWIAPVEYLAEEDMSLVFFSPVSARHSRHIAMNDRVAITVFDSTQAEYEPAPVMRLAGVQFEASVVKLEPPFPDLVQKQVEAWQLPMPPYAAYRARPLRCFLPVLKDGVNERIEIPIG